MGFYNRIYFILGVNTWAVGVDSRVIQISGGSLITQEGLFIVPSLTFERDGALLSIDGDFNKAGTLNFLVSERYAIYFHIV